MVEVHVGKGKKERVYSFPTWARAEKEARILSKWGEKNVSVVGGKERKKKRNQKSSSWFGFDADGFF